VIKLLDKLRARSTRSSRIRPDTGASAVEYGLLVALIAVVIAGTVVILGQTLNDKFSDVCATVQGNPDCESGVPAQ
jgi:pilus assembly protein Flp/PilA